MSDSKHDFEHISNDSAPGGGRHRSATTVTLTNEQFESLYLQPRMAGRNYSLTKSFANPTPLGITAFLLAHMPLSMDLLGFQGASAASGVAILGAYYACAGIGLYIACIMEWILGNTFPSVVFGTFGGFWISYGVLSQPTLAVAASFAPASDASNGITATVAGQATVGYNTGLGMYFLVWGIINLMYFICALRTNVPFAVVFFSLMMSFVTTSAGYFHSAKGNASVAGTLFKVGGGFNFVVALAALYIDFSLMLAAVGYPSIPLVDLSDRFMRPRTPVRDVEKEA